MLFSSYVELRPSKKENKEPDQILQMVWKNLLDYPVFDFPGMELRTGLIIVEADAQPEGKAEWSQSS